MLEVDIPSDMSGEGQRGFLPEGAPPIDGLVICYDASKESTFANVEGVLREWHLILLSRGDPDYARFDGEPEVANHCLCLQVGS